MLQSGEQIFEDRLNELRDKFNYPLKLFIWNRRGYLDNILDTAFKNFETGKFTSWMYTDFLKLLRD